MIYDDRPRACRAFECAPKFNAHGIERGFRADRFAPLQRTTETAEEEMLLGMPDFAPA